MILFPLLLNAHRKKIRTFWGIYFCPEIPLPHQKRTGAKRPFDRTKILKSIATALRKRNFTNEDIEKLSDRIVLELESSTTKEIKSRAIGKLIMQELAKIDPVAYIRFASVYKDFSNAQDFAKFISKIKN